MEVSESNSDVFLNCTAKPGKGAGRGAKPISLCNTWEATQRFPSPFPWEESGDFKRSLDDAFTRKSVSKTELQKESGVQSEELLYSPSAFKVRQFLHSFHYPGNALHSKKTSHLQTSSWVVSDVAPMSSNRAPQQAAKAQSGGSTGVKAEPSQRISRHHQTLSMSIFPQEQMDSVFLGDIPQPPPHPLSTSDSSVIGMGGMFPPWNASVAGTTYSLPCGGGSTRAIDHFSVGSIGGASLGAVEMPTPSLMQQSIGDNGKVQIPFSLLSVGRPDSSLLEHQSPSLTRVEEELNLNPFTAAYRNFTETSLSNIYHTLSLMGQEIETFAYNHLVENYYQNGEENHSANPGGMYRGVEHSSYHESSPPLGGAPHSLLGVFSEDSASSSAFRWDSANSHGGYFSMALSLKKQAVRKQTGSGNMLLPFFIEEKHSFLSGEDLSHPSKNYTVPLVPDGQRTGSEKFPGPSFIVPPEERLNGKDVPRRSSVVDVQNLPSDRKPDSPLASFPSGLTSSGSPQYPLCTENNYFMYTDDWFDEFPLPYPHDNAKIALTMEAPRFFCGMLLDPVSERYLFGGEAFYEECRVLKVLIDPESYMRDVQKDSKRLSEGGAEAFLFDAASTTSEKTMARILCREYISLRRAHQGFIVQTFSLIEPGVKMEGRRNQLVSAAVVKTLLHHLRAGAVTRAFGLQQVMTVKAVKTAARAAPLAAGRSDSGPSLFLGSADSFLPTLFFAHNILPRSMAPSPRSFLRSKRNSTLGVSMSRFRNDPTGNVEEETYFLSPDGGSLQPTVDIKMQQHSSIYMKAIDNIKGFLIFFKDQFSIRTMIKVFFHSVRCLQHFFRYCLAKKQRAMTRMVRLWRFLELDCRQKLHHYHPLPSSTERIDMIAANLLLPQMITPREYKQGIIEEMWKKRRSEYRTWEKECKEEEFLKTCDVSILPKQGIQTIPYPASTEKGSVVPFSEVENAVERTLERLWEKEKEEACYYTNTGCFAPDSYAPEGTTERGRRETLMDSFRKNRLKDEMHHRFGWYIEPEQLLYESHSRLLTSLKESVLTMEEVRLEIQSISLERAERGKSTNSKQGNQSNRGFSS